MRENITSYTTKGVKNDEAHEYDFAGNSITAVCNSVTNEYTANNP
jgi:hypothetical protein